MQMFLITLQQITILFILILIAYILVKTKMLRPDAVDVLSKIVMNVAAPSIMFNAMAGIDDVHYLQQGLFYSAVGQLGMILLSLILVRPTAKTLNIGAERGATSISNSAFMGIPLLTALYGKTGTMYATIYGIIWSIAFWCYTVPSIKKSRSLKETLKNLLSVGTISVVLALGLYFAHIKLPTIILTALTYTGNLSTPLSMFCIGITVASMDFRKMFNRRTLYLTAVKIVIIPVILLGLFFALGWVDECGRCVLIACACPTSVTVSVIAKQLQPDDDTGASVFVLTTLFSLLTISVLAGMMG